MEAFSLRGLGRLAESWKTESALSPATMQFGNAIAEYRQKSSRAIHQACRRAGATRDPAAWFAKHRSEIEVAGLNPFAQAASLKVLAEYEQAPDCVEALGALNRWPGRSGVPIEEYFGNGRRAVPSCRPTCICQSACVKFGALDNELSVCRSAGADVNSAKHGHGKSRDEHFCKLGRTCSQSNYFR